MTPTPELDLDDISESLAGNGDAYARLVRRHQGKVAQRMWRFTRDRTAHEELVQDVFVEAYMSLRTYRAEAPFEHWLARIGTSVGYKFWKKKERERLQANLSPEDWERIPGEITESVEPSRAAEILHELLDRLPPRDRLVLTLRHVEDKSLEETAQLTGWSVTMVKVQAWRAKNKLKRLLQQVGVEGFS